MTEYQTEMTETTAESIAEPTETPAVQPPGQQPQVGSIMNVLTADLAAARDELVFVKAALNEREAWIRQHLQAQQQQ